MRASPYSNGRLSGACVFQKYHYNKHIMKLAIIETGGKQYTVVPGKSIKIEKISGVEKGAPVVFDKVLLLDDGKEIKIGSPHVLGAKIEAVCEEVGRSRKIKILKTKPKTRFKKRQGHRQHYLQVKIKQ